MVVKEITLEMISVATAAMGQKLKIIIIYTSPKYGFHGYGF